MTLETLEPTPGAALAPVTPPDTDSWVAVVGQVAKLATMVADTEFVPKGLRGSAAAVTAAILYGREIGLPPLTALTQVHVVEGRPALSAEGMRALILAAGHDFEIRAATGREATVAGRRRGSGRWAEVTWTLDQARAAGLIKPRSAWETFPRAMLVARATVELARQLFPDVIHGFRALEESDDTTPPETAPLALVEGAGPTVRRAPRAPRKPATPTVDPAPTETAPAPTPPPPLPGEAGYQTPTTGDPAPPAPPPVVGPPPEPAAELEPAAEPPADPDAAIEVLEPEPDTDAPARRRDIVRVLLDFERLEITDRDIRLAYIGAIIGREIDSTNALTRREAGTVADTTGYCQTADDLDRSVTATLEHRAATEVAP